MQSSSHDRDVRLLWLSLFRACAASLLVVASALGQTVTATLPFAVAAVAYGWILVTTLLVRRKSSQRWLEAQAAFDPVFAAAIVALSGGINSPLWFAFLLAIIAGAAVGGPRSSIIAAGWSSALSCAVVFSAGSSERTHVLELALQLVAQWLVAVLSAFLANQLDRAGGRLAQSQLSLVEVTALKNVIVESMPSGLLTVDSVGSVSFSNEVARTILANDLSTNASVQTLIPGINLTQELTRAEFTINTSRGSRVLGVTTKRLQAAPRDQATLVVFQDLTELRQLEVELRRIDHLAELGRLSATLAHEVRNPLASMRGAAQLLQQQAVTEQQERLSRLIIKESDRLGALVESYLSLARPPPPVTRRTRLDVVASETIDLLRTDPEARTIPSMVLEPVEANVDGGQIRQALINLIRNAQKAVSAGGRVVISCKLDAGQPLLQVWDDAGRIPPDELSRLFEPFFSTWSGTGLGLSTVQSIVVAHGGSVSVTSSKAAGTLFSLRFPPVQETS